MADLACRLARPELILTATLILRKITEFLFGSAKSRCFYAALGAKMV